MASTGVFTAVSAGVKRASVLVLCVTVAVRIISCSESGGGGVVVDDDSYPSAVADLHVKTVAETSVTLEWTAPGDIDAVGTAVQYDMRFSKSEITWQNFETQPQLVGEPQPSP
jgi:hypothetical protein